MYRDSFAKWSKILFLVAGIVLSFSHAAYADNTFPAPTSTMPHPEPAVPSRVVAEPNPNENPMLAQYIRDGIKLYYLGSRSGLDGWYLVKDGQVHIMYTTADKQSLIVGVLYSVNGEAISQRQIEELGSEHPEIALSVQQNLAKIQQNTLSPAKAAPGDTAGSQAGERLVQELQLAASVDMGDHQAPQIYMIMDPNCPHCQATWRALHDFISKKTLQIHMIPIGLNDEDESAAAILLKSSDPMTAWDKYIAGDKTALAGKVDPLALGFVKGNHTLIDRWSITQTPYIVYRGKDKKVKIIAGEPQKIDDLMNDLGTNFMANWLEKVTSSLAAKPKTGNLPALRPNQVPSLQDQPAPEAQAVLPGAAIIYGVGASALFVFGAYFLLTGRWFTGVLVCVVGGCLLGFALQMMKR